MFVLFLFPAFLILLFGLAVTRAGQRGACAAIWACSLVVSNISAYLAVSPEAPVIWVSLALGAPLICVAFALYTRFVQLSQNGESKLSNSPFAVRRFKIATLALALLPISCIALAKFQMTQLDAHIADCKQAVASALIGNKPTKPCEEPELTCAPPNGFDAQWVSRSSLVYTGSLVGQGVFLDAHLHDGEVTWECHVFPKLFGTATCQGYDVGWH